ncbi:MAG: CBS domain-containing protein, partial [Nitrososphaerales archaeon]
KQDLRRFLDLGGDPNEPVRSQAYQSAQVGFPDEPLRVAADRLNQTVYAALPIVSLEEPSRVIGLITREDLFIARAMWLDEDRRRERLLRVQTYLNPLGMRRKPPTPPATPRSPE